MKTCWSWKIQTKEGKESKRKNKNKRPTLLHTQEAHKNQKTGNPNIYAENPGGGGAHL